MMYTESCFMYNLWILFTYIWFTFFMKYLYFLLFQFTLLMKKDFKALPYARE